MSELLTEAAACAYVQVFSERKDPVRQFADWARRWGVPVKRVGRARLYDPKILDAFLNRDEWTKRHRPAKAAEPTANLRLVAGLRKR